MSINGRALAATSIGTLFIWSGIRGWSVLATIGDVVKGYQPSQSVVNPLEIVPTGSANTGGTPTGLPSSVGGLASLALQGIGHAYHFGNAPGPDGKNPWDCSSFINYVVGVQAKMAIPGFGPGKYNGKSHGPPTGVWAAWTGMATVKRADVQAGDILVWFGHMGMATGHDTMISALNPHAGTKTQRIDSGVGRGPLVRIGRLR